MADPTAAGVATGGDFRESEEEKLVALGTFFQENKEVLRETIEYMKYRMKPFHRKVREDYGIGQFILGGLIITAMSLFLFLPAFSSFSGKAVIWNPWPSIVQPSEIPASINSYFQLKKEGDKQ